MKYFLKLLHKWQFSWGRVTLPNISTSIPRLSTGWPIKHERNIFRREVTHVHGMYTDLIIEMGCFLFKPNISHSCIIGHPVSIQPIVSMAQLQIITITTMAQKQWHFQDYYNLELGHFQEYYSWTLSGVLSLDTFRSIIPGHFQEYYPSTLPGVLSLDTFRSTIPWYFQ